MEEYRRVIRTMLTRSASSEFYDMEVINDLYAGNAMIIPNDYWVVSGEFRRKTHQGYLDEGEVWDANRILNETKVVHFSDWPRPKPWFPASDDILAKTTPACDTMPGSAHQDCSNRDAWLWLYKDFAERRGVCATFQVPERLTNIFSRKSVEWCLHCIRANSRYAIKTVYIFQCNQAEAIQDGILVPTSKHLGSDTCGCP